MRLLLVEDEDLLRVQLVKALEDNEYIVDSVSAGELGLYLAKEFSYDAAIIDLGLPKMNGIDLIKAIRSEGTILPVLDSPRQRQLD